MKEKERMNIVVVGHVDHGKSTLIGRLLYDTDSLPKGKLEEIKKTCATLGKELEFAYVLDALEEEREQNRTIDTTQIFFKTEKRDYVIIDAPGHVEFVKNMITGASQAEAAILVVSAKEGIQEQTKRHAYILSLLGLKEQLIVVINIFDLVNYNEEKFNIIKKESLEFLSKLNMKPSYILPISAKEGDNIASRSERISWYNSLILLKALDTLKTKEKAVDKPLRFPVQDVYKLNDKRVIVGRIEGGKIRKGDEIIFLPSKMKSTVNSIEIFNKQREEAEAGESIGITIQDPLFIERGVIICKVGNLPKVTDRIRANVFWMSEKDFDINEKITLKLATQEVSATVKKIEERINTSTLEEIEKDAKILRKNEVGTMIIETANPLVAENFNSVPELGRFVFEKEGVVSAGGIIIGC